MKFVAGHTLAGAVVILGTLMVTLVFYVIGLASSPQGIETPVAVLPEFLALMFTVGVFAVLVSTASFLLSVLLTWLRTKRNFPAWLPVVTIPVLAFVVVLLVFGRTIDKGFVAAVSGAAFVYFGTYWTILTSSGAVLDFFSRKFWNRKTA